MINFYFLTSGTLKRKDNTLVFLTEEEEKKIPVHQIDALYFYGEVNLNKRCLEFCNKHHIELVFYSYYGHLIGRFTPNIPLSGNIFIQQFEAYNNNETRLRIAKGIQKAAIHNCLSLLKYYRKNGCQLNSQIKKIEEKLPLFEQIHSLDELLLLEAHVKKIYYSGLEVILEGTGFCFNRRSMHPPKNEFNSMMSFGYHLLYGVVLKEIDQSLLYAEIAFIHSDIRKGPNLHYDLSDIYKPFIIDRIILRLIRRRQIHPADFSIKENYCFMDEKVKRIFIHEFNLELEKPIEYENRKRSKKSIIKRDIYKLVEYIENTTSGEPDFFCMGW